MENNMKREEKHTRCPEKKCFNPGNLLYPLPAVMVTCGDMERSNIITVAWAGTVCSDPAMVSISIRPERYSHGIISSTGEFAVNLVTRKLIRATDLCGVISGRNTDKFMETGLTKAPAFKVSCPVIAESPVSIECGVQKIIKLGTHDMFLARVLCLDVSEAVIDRTGKFLLNSSGLAVYSHGEYFSLGEKLGSFGYSIRKKPKKKTDKKRRG